MEQWANPQLLVNRLPTQNMNLIFLLSLIAGGTGFWCALTEGKKVGAHGTVIGVVVGAAVGFVGFWGMRILLGKKFLEPISRCKKWVQYVVGYLLFFAAVLWVVSCGFAGSWLTKLALRL